MKYTKDSWDEDRPIVDNNSGQVLSEKHVRSILNAIRNHYRNRNNNGDCQTLENISKILFRNGLYEPQNDGPGICNLSVNKENK